MKNKVLGTAVVLSLVTACGASSPPNAASPAEPVAAAPVAEVVEPAPAPAPAPAEPTPEQKQKAEALARLEQDRAKMLAEHQAEVARFTPELHAEAKALAEKTYPNGRAAIKAAVASKTRNPANVERDVYRHPVETLEFLGFKPTMTVLEYGPGGGWYTELLAPALAQKGKLLATNGDPNGPAESRGTYYAQRFKLFLETSPELYGKVETVTVDGAAPKLPQEGTVDMVLLFRELHGMVNSGKLAVWLGEFHKALKPKGVLAIEQHRAPADADPIKSAQNGYLPEKWVIEQIEAAGFKLAGKSEINANPKDTKDYPEGVWTLPPSYQLGDVDRAKYAAIGESDRMTLKFVKVAEKKQPAPAAAAAAPAGAPASAATSKPAAADKSAAAAAPASHAAPAAPAKPAAPASGPTATK